MVSNYRHVILCYLTSTCIHFYYDCGCCELAVCSAQRKHRVCVLSGRLRDTGYLQTEASSIALLECFRDVENQ